MSCIRGTAIHIIQCYWVVVVVSKWSFENILVATPPKNTCDCRAPLGLPRRRGCATSHPHSTPMTCRQMNGCRAQFGGQGAWRGALPGTGLLAPRGGGYPQNSCDSRAPLGLPPPRVGSTPFLHNSPTICRQKMGADERFGEWGPLGEECAHPPGWRIIVSTWKSQCHCNSVCIINACPAAAVLCCMGRLVHRWVVGLVRGCGRMVSEYVDGRVYSWL